MYQVMRYFYLTNLLIPPPSPPGGAREILLWLARHLTITGVMLGLQVFGAGSRTYLEMSAPDRN